MSGPTHRLIETNAIQMHVAEQGEGPLVLLCHGFPELWYSWRHQLTALAAAGFHAVAPTCAATVRRIGQSSSTQERKHMFLLINQSNLSSLCDTNQSSRVR
jgi:alpha-beta hydrolase superfamily lysophospholipase